MTPTRRKQAGFTLVELLVVIAIIGILAGFLFSGIPKILEKAKTTKARATMAQINLMLAEYLTTHGSYPPAFGYLNKFARDIPATTRGSFPQASTVFVNGVNEPSRKFFVRKSWTSFIGITKNTDLYDPFAMDTSDTNWNSQTDRLEFYTDGELGEITDYSTSIIPGQRPFIYIPVNKRQMKKVANEWIREWKTNYQNDSSENNPTTLGGPRPNDQNDVNGMLQNMNFPPAKYDAYVLVSVGPTLDTRGLVYDLYPNGLLDISQYQPNYRYHVAAMASYFMLTRDLNIRTTSGEIEGDGLLDFDFDARNRSQQKFPDNFFPTPDGPGIAGPIIFWSE